MEKNAGILLCFPEAGIPSMRARIESCQPERDKRQSDARLA